MTHIQIFIIFVLLLVWPKRHIHFKNKKVIRDNGKVLLKYRLHKVKLVNKCRSIVHLLKILFCHYMQISEKRRCLKRKGVAQNEWIKYLIFRGYMYDSSSIS